MTSPIAKDSGYRTGILCLGFDLWQISLGKEPYWSNLPRSMGDGMSVFYREKRGHSVLLSWRKIDRSIQDIAGLDAEKLPPFAIAQVLQVRCPFAPRIPHHCTERMFLPQSDSTLQVRIQQVNLVLSVAVGSVGRRGDGDVTVLRLLLVRVSVVEVAHAIKSPQPRFLYVCNPVVGVERLFEAEGRCPGVLANELQTQLRAKCNAVHEAKVSRPPFLRAPITLREHGHGNSVFIFNDGLELPHSCTDESMCRSVRVVQLASEPGKTNRNSPSDCLAFLPVGFRADEKQFVIVRGLPGGHVGAMQIYLARPESACDLYSRQPTVSF